MIQSNAGQLKSIEEAKLPWRDWILLPMLSLLTICLLLGCSELIARRVLPASGTGLVNCTEKDPVWGLRAKANTVCFEKLAESQFVTEYRFNNCGHRAGMECGPKPPGTYRMVMTGSSMAMGLYTPREMAFAALLPKELSRQTGRTIEVYDEAGWAFPPRAVAQSFNEVLSADPDMILWVITAMDIRQEPFEGPDPGRAKVAAEVAAEPVNRSSHLAVVWHKVKVALAAGSLEQGLRDIWEQTRTAIALRHFLYEGESRQQYVEAYLRNGDDETGFLKAQPSARWESRLGQTNVDAADIEARAKAAGVPLVAVLVPERPQAAMIAMKEWPAGYNPFKLDDELRSIITSHGETYIDILPDYRNIPNPEQGYFPVDGHLNADGHRIVSGLLAKALTSGAVPALRVAAQPQAAQEQGR